MKNTPLFFPFLLALLAFLFAPLFFPGVRLIAFGPFLAITFMRQSFISSLWIAALCGLVVDLFNFEMIFGINALNYTLTALILYRQKRHFFEEKPLALSLYTALICSLSSIIQISLIYAFGPELPFNLKAAAKEFIIMPLADALFAFLWFTCSMQLYQYVKKLKFRAIPK